MICGKRVRSLVGKRGVVCGDGEGGGALCSAPLDRALVDKTASVVIGVCIACAHAHTCA